MDSLTFFEPLEPFWVLLTKNQVIHSLFADFSFSFGGIEGLQNRDILANSLIIFFQIIFVSCVLIFSYGFRSFFW